MGRRRRRRATRAASGLLILGGVAASTWWLYRAERSTAQEDAGVLLAGQSDSTVPPPTSATPTAAIPEPTPAPPAELAKPQPAPPPEEPKPLKTDSVPGLIAAGREALNRQDRLAARTLWNQALREDATDENRTILRAELGRLAQDTVLSGTIVTGDPLVERYVIRTGDVLAKIAAANKISPELLASANGIADKNLIREGQTIKIIKGPFRAVVHKSEYRLDLYLGDTFIREYRVGLGADDSTPTGEWRVATKLVNPTYYPPRGGQIVAADDPANPLGERWIGLVGISGEAVAQQRYGIHGTNEPDSIGKSLSMGCVRLHNADVETLYTYLVETHSTVSVIE